LTILADSAVATDEPRAPLGQTLAFMTNLTLGTGESEARVRYTFAVYAALVTTTRQLGAAVDAHAVTTEFTGPTVHLIAGVTHALSVDADLLVRTANLVACVGHANAAIAGLPGGAADADAGIHTHAHVAGVTLGTIGGDAWIHTPAITAHQTRRALQVLARLHTDTLGTHGVTGTDRSFVQLTVTIVVDGVTDLFGENAATATGVAKPLVDGAITVVVQVVAELGAREALLIADLDTVETRQDTPAARTQLASRTGWRRVADGLFVDVLVAVVVQPITDLVGRLDVLNAGQTTAFAALGAGAAGAEEARIAFVIDSG
jgi:hypothetical protein